MLSVIDFVPGPMYNNGNFTGGDKVEKVLSRHCVYDKTTGIIIIVVYKKEIDKS